MTQLAQTTKVHPKKKSREIELDTEALALAKRVTKRLKQPLAVKSQIAVDHDHHNGEYFPQDIVVKAKK